MSDIKGTSAYGHVRPQQVILIDGTGDVTGLDGVYRAVVKQVTTISTMTIANADSVKGNATGYNGVTLSVGDVIEGEITQVQLSSGLLELWTSQHQQDGAE